MRWTSLAEDPDGAGAVRTIERDVPPRFLAVLTSRAREEHAAAAPQLTWLIADGAPVAVVRAVRLRWTGGADDAPAGGLGEALARADEAGADTLAVLDVTVTSAARGRGVGAALLAALDARRAELGLARTLVLMRPHAKAEHPLVPFGRYAAFATAEGVPFDPWFRAAWRAGYVPVRGVDRSLVAHAEVAAWRSWLGIELPGSGPYLAPGAIKPAIIEVERDEGRYREPHLWMGTDGPPQPPSRPDDWVAALAAAGVVAGDRTHREVRRAR